MAQGLTVKQRRLVKGIVEGKSKKEAAIEANYSRRSAGQNANEALAIPKVKRAIEIALEKAGLTDNRVAEVLNEGLQANRVISAIVIKKKGTAEMAEANENTNDFIEVPDHAVRHKYLETLVDLRGLKVLPKEEPIAPVQVNILVQQFIDKIYDGKN